MYNNSCEPKIRFQAVVNAQFTTVFSTLGSG